MILRKDVRAFVDWRSQISNAGQTTEPRLSRKAQFTADYVAASIAACLNSLGGYDMYRVTVTAYHGWHRGLTPSDNRKALGDLQGDGSLTSRIGNVLFDWATLFGDRSLDAFDHRLNRRVPIHYPDTLRADFSDPTRFREKMVDTAIACDVLHSARSEPDSWRIVMAEDDDVVPPVFMAEKWSKNKGGRTSILRSRSAFGHLSLEGLILPLKAVL